AWFFHSGRRSLEGLDPEICQALGLKPAEAKNFPPPATPDEERWNKYFRNKYDHVLGKSRLVEAIAIRADNEVNALCAALACSMSTTNGLAASRSAMCPDFFYWSYKRDFLKNELADLSKEITKALDEVAARAMAEGGIKALPPKKYAPEPARPAAVRLTRIAGKETTLQGVLQRISRLHGWDADAETAPDLPYAKYQEALHRRIPLILEDKGNQRWLVCVGYVDEGDKHFLLLCDPTKLAKEEMQIDRKAAWPEAGFWFEEFAAGKYEAWIVHNWSDALKAWRKEIEEAVNKAEKKEG
ncbi:MAG: hypothetical protein N3A66_06245, partial [Planctomycetota bacterium]|nr:hypothetical protein [Planctomycetota bacterium]